MTITGKSDGTDGYDPCKTLPRKPPDKRKVYRPIQPDSARKILVHAKIDGSLKTVHSFLVHKFLQGILSEAPVDVKKLRSGDYLIIVKDGKQAKTLLKIEKFCEIDVEVTAPTNWNSCKGIVYHPDFSDLDDDTIEE